MRGFKHQRRGGFAERSEGVRAPRVLSGDELRLLLLSLIDETERHGYELIRRIKSLSRGHYAPSSGMVYPALGELAEAGLAVQSEGEGGRKLFIASAAGVAESKAREREITAIRERLEQLQGAQADEPAPVRRARANLDMALANALASAATRDGLDDIDAIVELLDATTRQIERLGR